MALDIDGLYRAAEDSRRNAFETAQAESQRRLRANLSQIQSTYRDSVTQAQNAARISALGQEEKLAAAGLNSGGVYAAPTSGYAESSRIARDNSLRSNLNALSAQRLKQEQAAHSTSSTEIAQASQEYWNSMADLRTSLAQAKTEQYNADRSYELSVKRYQASQYQTAYSQAMQRWQTYGYVLPADAAILGVKAGTQTADKAYKEAQLALSRWKALLP